MTSPMSWEEKKRRQIKYHIYEEMAMTDQLRITSVSDLRILASGRGGFQKAKGHRKRFIRCVSIRESLSFGFSVPKGVVRSVDRPM